METLSDVLSTVSLMALVLWAWIITRSSMDRLTAQNERLTELEMKSARRPGRPRKTPASTEGAS